MERAVQLIAGYLEFVALLFLPGAAFMDLFSVGTSLSFSERVAIAWGLSMAATALTLFVRTSGVVVAGQELRGFWGLSVTPILAVSLVVWVAALVWRRKSVFLVKPSKWDVAILLLVVLQAALLLAHFAKYPIFPSSVSTDFQQTAGVSLSLQSGQVTSVPSGVLYYGVHLLIGALLVLSSAAPLTASQDALAIIAALSPFMVYSFVLSLGLSKRSALYTAVIYVGTGFVWYGMLFDSGLYANFYGILSAMLVMILLRVARSEPRRYQMWIAFGAGVANLYISHYSVLTVLPAVLALLVIQSAVDRKLDRPLLFATAVLFAPVVVAVSLFPGLPSTLISFLAPSPKNNVLASTALSALLSAFPFASYVVTEITDDILSVIMLVLAGVGVALSLRNRSSVFLFPALWFLALLVSAPLNESAWRFSFVALLPLTVLSAIGVDRLSSWGTTERPKKKVRRRLGAGGTNYRTVLTAALLLVMVASSEVPVVMSDAVSNTSTSLLAQQYVYQAMQWISKNATEAGGVVSPTELDFIYSQLTIGRPGAALTMIDPDTLVTNAKQNGWAYVALTNYVTLAGTAGGYRHLLQLYAKDKRFQLVYTNPDVYLYRIVGNSTG